MASPASSPDEPHDLQAALDALVAGRSSGAIALVQTPNGTWLGASGHAADGRPVEPTDKFGVASTTKTFVATVVLQLVGEGRLSLDDSLETWLPGRIREGKRITIRQLLNHTSGLPPDWARRESLVAEPGTQHHYSNSNYVLLGDLVEELTGDSLDVAVRDRIFRPLALEDSSGPPGGAGGIVSTAADVATFFGALLRGELLGADQLSEMLRTVDTSTDPGAARAAADSRAGLGIFVFELACGWPWGHGGDMPGWSNQVLASRDGSTIVVVAQNVMGWPKANATAVEMYCL